MVLPTDRPGSAFSKATRVKCGERLVSDESRQQRDRGRDEDESRFGD